MEGNLTLLDQILIALALAMDCFTVSIASGLILQTRIWPDSEAQMH